MDKKLRETTYLCVKIMNSKLFIIKQRTVSFKLRPVHVHIYVRTKIQSVKFPWDLYWENKPYKLKRSIPRNPVQQENPGVNALSFEQELITKQNVSRRFKAIKCQPFWALLQTQMTDFPTLQYTSTSEIPDPLIYLRPKKAMYPFRGEHPRRVQAIIERIPRYKKSPKSRTTIHPFKIIILSPHGVNDRFSFSQIYLIHDTHQPRGRGCQFLRRQTSIKNCQWKKSRLSLFILDNRK